MIKAESFPGAVALSGREAYFFDLQGFIVLPSALDRDEVAACNQVLDRYQRLGKGEWSGRVHDHGSGPQEGVVLQQIYEGGEAFERLIDHPGYIEKVRRLVGGEGTFDYWHGPLYLDECFAGIRGPGEAVSMHSGGFPWCQRTQFLVRDGRFHCGQVNALVAFGDIGPGDGATMVVPGSHKSNFAHPDAPADWSRRPPSMDGVEGAVEVHLRAGDALLFVDALMHGSAARVNAGQRRIAVYRYGPSWGRSRRGYQPSAELLARLTPARRRIVQPQDALLPP